MTEITLRMPDSVIRKIRAYNILVGGDSKNFETTLVTLIERTVSSQIRDAVTDIDPDVALPVRRTASPLIGNRLSRLVDEIPFFHDSDVSGISTGLGDDAPADEEEAAATVDSIMEDPYLAESGPGRAQRGGGLTDDELARDMSVSDPKHEAKADSRTFADSMEDGSPENLFAEVAGLPKPAVDPRIAKRNHAKTAPGRRARVRPMSENESESAP